MYCLPIELEGNIILFDAIFYSSKTNQRILFGTDKMQKEMQKESKFQRYLSLSYTFSCFFIYSYT